MASSGVARAQMVKEMQSPMAGGFYTMLVLDDPEGFSSGSDPTSSGETDSEGNSSPDPQASKYSLLAGDSDNELEEVEIFCEETISLLAHEILCCEGDSDSETETDEEETQLEGVLEYGLFNPYQLILSEEEDGNQNGSSVEEEEQEVSLLMASEVDFLMEEDQQSEEKKEANKVGCCF
ncbi:uncharacterized protein LOC108105023 [Drosophila eugracilis]|uniref:uncharacterized protein LOC108105023 n=1 Tax=Drosophila eugracilis TaxID=29029 RepID=UPI0007E85A94|nr:uncharacterized protein LOC108105023 [Drosophila eugracilis]